MECHRWHLYLSSLRCPPCIPNQTWEKQTRNSLHVSLATTNEETTRERKDTKQVENQPSRPSCVLGGTNYNPMRLPIRYAMGYTTLLSLCSLAGIPSYFPCESDASRNILRDLPYDFPRVPTVNPTRHHMEITIGRSIKIPWVHRSPTRSTMGSPMRSKGTSYRIPWDIP